MRAAFHDPTVERRFRDEGYVVLPFLNKAEVAGLLALHDGARSGLGTGFYTSLWSSDVAYRERVHRDVGTVLAEPVGRLLRDYRMILANFVVKHAGPDDSSVPVHQDWSLVDEAEHLPVSFWCPLVDVTPENGCLAVVPRSHRLVGGIRPNQPHGAGFSPFRDLHAKVGAELLREVPMLAGDVIVYSTALLHASRPNRSHGTRVAVVSVFVPVEAPLRHYYQETPEYADAYNVPDDFYWNRVALASRPDASLWSDRVPAAAGPLTSEELDALLARAGGKPAPA